MPPGGERQPAAADLSFYEMLMATFPFRRSLAVIGFIALLSPAIVRAQGNYAVEGGEYNIAGVLAGEQMYPQVSIKTSGGYVVWQDKFTDGAGLGVSARQLDSSLSGVLSTFRVNETGADDQERPSV